MEEKSRYIRTKDGKIYDLESKEVSSWNYNDEENAYEIYYYNGLKGQHIEFDDKGGYSMDCIYENEIIKQADIIEELCDEFVVYHKYEDGSEYFGLCRKDYDYKNYIKGDIIYGAVWTSKGLIYVAKMNENGELELL